MKLTVLAVAGLAAASLAGCADDRARNSAARPLAAPTQGPAASIDPGANAGQTTSVTSGSVSNTASGSQATPPSTRPLR
jgi:hypothetical protein